MPILLSTLLATLSSMFRSGAALELEHMALRHQVGVLQRSARKRPKLTSADRLLRVWLSRIWGDWRSPLAIVKPETVIAWHRKGFRLFWTWKIRRAQKAGRPAFCATSCYNPLPSAKGWGERLVGYRTSLGLAEGVRETPLR